MGYQVGLLLMDTVGVAWAQLSVGLVNVPMLLLVPLGVEEVVSIVGAPCLLPEPPPLVPPIIEALHLSPRNVLDLRRRFGIYLGCARRR